MSDSFDSGGKARRVIAVDLGAESCRVSLLNWQEKGATLALYTGYVMARRNETAIFTGT